MPVRTRTVLVRGTTYVAVCRRRREYTVQYSRPDTAERSGPTRRYVSRICTDCAITPVPSELVALGLAVRLVSAVRTCLDLRANVLSASDRVVVQPMSSSSSGTYDVTVTSCWRQTTAARWDWERTTGTESHWNESRFRSNATGQGYD